MSSTIPRRLLEIALIASAISCSATQHALAQDTKPVLAVKAFENPSELANSTVGTGLTDLFVTELHKAGRYEVVDLQTQELLKELGGSAATPEYVFVAKITNFGAVKKEGGLGALTRVVAGVGVKSERAVVRIDFRILQIKTGRTLVADFCEATHEQKGLALAGGMLFEGLGAAAFQSEEFLGSMLGQATLKAIRNCVAKLDTALPGPSPDSARPPNAVP